MIRIRPSFLSDADTLAPDLRAADRSEIEANSGREPAFALRQSIQYSKECWTVLVDGKIACIFGVGQVGDNGVPWMLGSNLIARHAKTLMYLAPRFVETWKRRWPLLADLVPLPEAPPRPEKAPRAPAPKAAAPPAVTPTATPAQAPAPPKAKPAQLTLF
jgi:hypothetical protein